MVLFVVVVYVTLVAIVVFCVFVSRPLKNMKHVQVRDRCYRSMRAIFCAATKINYESEEGRNGLDGFCDWRKLTPLLQMLFRSRRKNLSRLLNIPLTVTKHTQESTNNNKEDVDII